ncbi:MAG: PilZ domain-containing protein [Candidatus Sedimenticola sp. 20ELBAFRAG]
MEEYLGDGLVYESKLPLSCEIADESTLEQGVQGAASRNERLLQCLIALDERRKETSDEDDEHSAELLRLEAKVDMLLELVSGLVQQQDQVALPVLLRLGSEGMNWVVKDTELRAGQYVWVTLDVDARLPQALKLPSLVRDISDHKDGRLVSVGFIDQGERFSDLLQKFIFRHHRRQVAKMKATRQPGQGE